jgi:membrane associated rhomboid family serine protease
VKNITPRLFFSILYPFLFVAILWCIRIYENTTQVELSYYGLYPRTIHGLLGILTTPLLHADNNHLWSNTLPLLILGSVMFYFYRAIAFQVFGWVYIMTGIWVWVMAQPAYHIGASGLVYGFVTFLFFSGVFRKDTRLLAISMFVAFLYGSILYGIFPLVKGMSWESHLMGALAGVITAYHFRNEGPPARVYDLGDDDENDTIDVTDDEHPEIIEVPEPPPNNVTVHYTIIPKEKEN